jgi:hypothetical protein
VETTGIMRCLPNNINDSSRRTGKEHDVFCSNSARQPFSLLDQSTACLQSRTLGRR